MQKHLFIPACALTLAAIVQTALGFAVFYKALRPADESVGTLGALVTFGLLFSVVTLYIGRMLKENRYDRPPFWFVLLTGILPAFLIFWAWEQFPAFGGSAGSLSAYGRLGLHDRVAHDAKGNGTV